MIPAPITIGRNVWLGAPVTVVPGDVTKDVPADTVVGGIPARAIRATGFGPASAGESGRHDRGRASPSGRQWASSTCVRVVAAVMPAGHPA